jgi:hypothetical protein
MVQAWYSIIMLIVVLVFFFFLLVLYYKGSLLLIIWFVSLFLFVPPLWFFPLYGTRLYVNSNCASQPPWSSNWLALMTPTCFLQCKLQKSLKTVPIERSQVFTLEKGNVVMLSMWPHAFVQTEKERQYVETSNTKTTAELNPWIVAGKIRFKHKVINISLNTPIYNKSWEFSITAHHWYNSDENFNSKMCYHLGMVYIFC